MGYMRHHTIVVTSWSKDAITQAHYRAKSIFPWVSPISPVVVNGYRSFFVPPDGSKEGWEPSKVGDKGRDEFIEWLEQVSDYCRWVEVQFGDEERKNKVLRNSK